MISFVQATILRSIEWISAELGGKGLGNIRCDGVCLAELCEYQALLPSGPASHNEKLVTALFATLYLRVRLPGTCPTEYFDLTRWKTDCRHSHISARTNGESGCKVHPGGN